MSASDTIDEIYAQNGIVVAAHPFNVNSLGSQIFDLSLDAVEGFNATTTFQSMIKTCYAAKVLGIPNLANSDAHQSQEIGRSLMLFPETAITMEELLKNLKLGNFKVDFTKTNTLAVIYRHIVQNTGFLYREAISRSNWPIITN